MIATYPQGCSNIEQPFFNKKTASIAVTTVLLLHGIAFVGLANITIPEAKPLKTIPRLEILFSKMPPPEVAQPEIQTVAMKPETIKPDTIKSEPIEKSAESKAKPTSNIQPKPIKEVVEPTPTATPPAVNSPVIKSTPNPTAILPVNTPVVKPTITPIATPSATTSVVQPAKPTVTPPVTTLANKPTITPITTTPATTSVVKPTAKPTVIPTTKSTLTPPTNNPVAKSTTATPPNSPTPTEPVILSSGQAHWKSKPPFSCGNNDTGGQTLSGMIRYSVNAQGNITNSSLVKSTGNRKVDNEVSRQARIARFFPYIKNGVAVASTVNFPFTITCS